jgi:hypothetical protein
MLTIIIVCVLAGAVGIGSVYYFGKDNPVEKEAEVVIKDETGISVDFDKIAKDPAPQPPASSNPPMVPDPKDPKKG